MTYAKYKKKRFQPDRASGCYFDELRNSEQFQELEPRQRREIGGKLFMQRMEQTAEEYSKLNDQQKKRFVRELADQMEQMRRDREAARPPAGDKSGSDSTQLRPNDSGTGPHAGGGRGGTRHGPPDPSRMRSMSERLSPEKRAKVKQLFDDMRKERESRNSSLGKRGAA